MHNPQEEQSASQTLPANDSAPASEAAASPPAPQPMPREIGAATAPSPRGSAIGKRRALHRFLAVRLPSEVTKHGAA
jgi:hypothetical protein